MVAQTWFNGGGDEAVAVWQGASGYGMEHDVLVNYNSDIAQVEMILQTHRDVINTGLEVIFQDMLEKKQPRMIAGLIKLSDVC